MKNKIIGIILGILVAMTIQGCQKAPINGKLDGQWEVMEVSPAPLKVIDLRLFYNFYLHVCQLTYYGDFFLDGNMTYNGETLWIAFPSDLTDEESLILAQYGISTNPVTFSVSFEGNNRMTLTSEETVVHLRKF